MPVAIHPVLLVLIVGTAALIGFSIGWGMADRGWKRQERRVEKLQRHASNYGTLLVLLSQPEIDALAEFATGYPMEEAEPAEAMAFESAMYKLREAKTRYE